MTLQEQLRQEKLRIKRLQARYDRLRARARFLRDDAINAYHDGYINGGLDILTNQTMLDQYLDDLYSEDPFVCLSSNEIYSLTQYH